MLTIHTEPDVVPDNAIQWCNVRFVRNPNRLVSFVRSFGRYNSEHAEWHISPFRKKDGSVWYSLYISS